MRLAIKRLAGDNNYELVRQDNVNIRWVHHQEDEDGMTDNSKADIYNKYRILARKTNELCGSMSTVLFTTESTLATPIIYGNTLYNPNDIVSHVSRFKLPIFYDDYNPIGLQRSSIIVHEVVINTFIKDREYGIKWKYETIPDTFDIAVLLRKMKITNLLS